MPLFQTLPPDAATMPSEARIGFQTAAKNRRFSAGFIIMPRPSGRQGSDRFAGRRTGRAGVPPVCQNISRRIKTTI
ncbi:TPA: hypothetical protein ACKMUH_001678 [Neisseria gonorrhoeae]|uniref:hypothetical protein n=1 Tax=Neisseria gonorrhoeae TaxID=485 RepID=UPI002163A0A3|nr:hypothetical protein [Neisseria gonorrhoeae]UWT12792.1 hypothetical protein NC849_08930 [Neisseria gonorrhoeae]UWT14841.1 hypothetical protein NC850_09000 [Neisseria gonorrhoeae]UXY67156.1 hypothetical protein OCL43_09025 [Neisseria gonorrhoeae]UXY69202.1 hypothetical protein OCL40_09010 [Neisseria gonorrhoeae]UXY71292.1 hypothetical protein OCL39_09005 [Neisseria gonorrhoeae]